MLKQAKNIFFLGIKGVAMANLAVFLKKMGKNVSGADVEEEFITDELLKKNKITWQIGFDLLPDNIDLVVYSASHKGLNNPLIKKAKEKNIAIISQAELLGELMKEFKTKIAVSGCHGKTTTSSLLAYALKKLNQKPSYIVGVPFFSGKEVGADFQSKNYFVVEADEYGINPPTDKTPKFFKYSPDWIITTNIDFDHPDVYENLEETKKAFLKFFDDKKLILNIDDENIFQLINQLKKERYLTYGFSDRADFQIINWSTREDGSEFEIKNLGRFKISLFGKHNISNATALIILLYKLGFKKEEIAKSIADFTGAKRRFQKIFYENSIWLFDDYAHHPKEIEATILAARERFPKNRLIIIFQPHTFSRTKALIEQFQQVLSKADLGYVLPIFASARENSSDFQISSLDLVKDQKNLFYVSSVEKLIDELKKVLKKDDVIFTIGAGDVYKISPKIKEVVLSLNKIKILENIDLKSFNTLKTSSIAQYFFEAKTKNDLVAAKKYSLEKKLPLLIIGGGSNLAILKEKIPGLVVKNSYQKLEVVEKKDDYVLILVSSGYPVSLLINQSIEKGWSGFEYHYGLPGTVGGAIYMNSKWTKPMTYFGDNLVFADLIDSFGKIKKVNRDYFQFAYDFSILQKTNEIFVEGIFKLKKDDPKKIKKKAMFSLEYRKKTQPFGVFSSGCFFKNPGNVSAGYLIDQTGLKGFSVGDFFVSPVHANFIVNKGNGKKEDLLKLLAIIKAKVKEKFNIQLKEEVKII